MALCIHTIGACMSFKGSGTAAFLRAPRGFSRINQGIFVARGLQSVHTVVHFSLYTTVYENTIFFLFAHWVVVKKYRCATIATSVKSLQRNCSQRPSSSQRGNNNNRLACTFIEPSLCTYTHVRVIPSSSSFPRERKRERERGDFFLLENLLHSWNRDNQRINKRRRANNKRGKKTGNLRRKEHFWPKPSVLQKFAIRVYVYSRT